MHYHSSTLELRLESPKLYLPSGKKETITINLISKSFKISLYGKTRVLFVCQEMFPYLPSSEIAKIGRNLPQKIQEKGREIRTFMPRYGCINERRHQLHEVIRLSGINLIIDDADHPLIIKVGSIQQARMQVYFIDNEEFFQRKHVLTNESGNQFPDNDERSIFFCKGVIETVKKLGWSPDVIHCNGWLTAPLPMMIKRLYNDEPLFEKTKVIYSVYEKSFHGSLNSRFWEKAMYPGISEEDVELIKDPTFENINKLGVKFSNGVIFGSEDVSPEIKDYVLKSDKHWLGHQNEEEYASAYSEFYDEILEANGAYV